MISHSNLNAASLQLNPELTIQRPELKLPRPSPEVIQLAQLRFGEVNCTNIPDNKRRKQIFAAILLDHSPRGRGMKLFLSFCFASFSYFHLFTWLFLFLLDILHKRASAVS